MVKRAVICIGVNRAGGMMPLQAAVKGAKEFEEWAKTQNCDTKLLVDEAGSEVFVAHIFKAVNEFVEAQIYDQLIIYFSGHGILTAPGAEYWLLSGAPQNPNEAVNLLRSVEDARNSGIPHVIFISDACRSAVQGPPLSGIAGGVIFPNRSFLPQRSEVDVFYATLPGDPAWEVPEAEAARGYSGIFTECLLKAVMAPDTSLQEPLTIGNNSVYVVSSRRLKTYLETQVPKDTGMVDIKLRQKPEVRVETALPKFFAVAHASPALATPPDNTERYTTHPPMYRAKHRKYPLTGAINVRRNILSEKQAKDNFEGEVNKLLQAQKDTWLASHTGFSIFGVKIRAVVASGWAPGLPLTNLDNHQAVHLPLLPDNPEGVKPATLLLQFSDGSGTVLPIIPDFIGIVVVKAGRVESVNYVPSRNSWRYREYERNAHQLEVMKANAAVASRQGQFVVPEKDAEKLADTIRQSKGIDPTMGLYAAYSYAQIGLYKDVLSVFNYMRWEREIPVPFDVMMLAKRYEPDSYLPEDVSVFPFAPMLTQGWSILMPDHPMHRPIHAQLRAHLIPSLWTTYTETGIEIIREALHNKTER